MLRENNDTSGLSQGTGVACHFSRHYYPNGYKKGQEKEIRASQGSLDCDLGG
jgi:hypothetical protein